ncbi:MAG: DUF4249 domain-containing protein [Bacteroidota bacterium]|nr:DUF4249 domain-containing protein [Bacteroidota bacterium]
MKKIFYIPSLLLLCLFSSCEKDADVELPEVKPKLVLAAFITPQDTLLTVDVTRSQPIFQSYNVNTSAAVTDATVIMSGNSGSVQLNFDPDHQRYQAPASALPIIPGNTYTLTVTTPLGESAHAETTVPYHNGVTGFSVDMQDSLTGDPFYSELHTTLTYYVTDYGGEENNYRFFSAILVRDTLTNDTISVRFINQLFTDGNRDGQQIQSTLDGGWSDYDPAGSSRKVIGYDYWMFNVNNDYYQLHNSFNNYAGSDPFSEPTLIYTNVFGGLGVFGAANGTKIRIYR